MINFIKKIFSIFEEHPDKKRKSSNGIVGTQGTSWSQSCTCCFCQPIKSIHPPSPSQLKRDVKKCKRNINVGTRGFKRINFMEERGNKTNNKSYLGNQTVEFVKIANKTRNQKNNKIS